MTYEGTKHYVATMIKGLGMEKHPKWMAVLPAGMLCGAFSWAFICRSALEQVLANQIFRY